MHMKTIDIKKLLGNARVILQKCFLKNIKASAYAA